MTKDDAIFEIRTRYAAILDCQKLIEKHMFEDPDKIKRYGRYIVENASRISELCQKWDIPHNPWG